MSKIVEIHADCNVRQELSTDDADGRRFSLFFLRNLRNRWILL